MTRACDIGMSLPSIELLYRGARSIYSAVFEGDDFGLRLRWTGVEQEGGYPHRLTHGGLKAINSFAGAALSAMQISGRRGATTALPLTETQSGSRRGTGTSLSSHTFPQSR